MRKVWGYFNPQYDSGGLNITTGPPIPISNSGKGKTKKQYRGCWWESLKILKSMKMKLLQSLHLTLN